MGLIPTLPLSLQELLDYYILAARECDFMESVFETGLAHIEARMKPSPLVSVQFNHYEAYYIDFLKHLKWRLSDLCVDEGYAFASSDPTLKILAHEYKHSGIAHPIGEEQILPMLESVDFVRTGLIEIISSIEASKLKSIFLCHSSKDKPFVRMIAEALTKKGARVWLDEAEITVGDSILEKIQLGISESDYLGIVLSPNSTESIWVKKEVEAALMEEIERGKVKVLPILIEKCEVPLFLKAKKFADLTNEERYDAGINELAKALSQ